MKNEIVEKLKSKEITLKQVMSRDLLFLVKHYWQEGNKPAMKACVSEARSRLEAKGLTYIEGEGWK